MYGFCGKVEQLQREGKQMTELEACHCRKARISEPALLIWVQLNTLAKQAGQMIYELKHGLNDYLCQQLKKPF